MSGNVYDWVWDRHASNYTGAATTDPTGPASGSARVLRGGGWVLGARLVRVAARDWYAPGIRDNRFGFRLVRSVP